MDSGVVIAGIAQRNNGNWSWCDLCTEGCRFQGFLLLSIVYSVAKYEAVMLFIEEVLVSQRWCSAQCWSSHDSKFLIHIRTPGSSCNQQWS